MISLVYAVSENGVIGAGGGLPWHVPSDLQHFKAVTMGKPIIMGRKTWDSLPRKPLPGRRNIVLTHDVKFAAQGAEIMRDVESSSQATSDVAEACVIGGAEIFKAFLPLAQRVYLTRILATVAGDVVMPELDEGVWREISRSAPQRGEKDSADFQTFVFERR